MWFPFLVEGDVPASVRSAFDDVEAAIRDASYRVRGELATARFNVDQDGEPVEQSVTNAIKDATKAQLTFWAETGDVTGAAAQNGGGSILSVSLPSGPATTDARTKHEARTAPAVADILRHIPGIDWAVGYE